MANYRWGKKIGSGGFGVVYRAYREDGLECAMKRLEKDADDESRQRFKREVRLQTTLDHPNILRILGSNLNADPPWYAMPLAERSLRDAMPDMHGDEDAVLEVILAIANGIEHAHANGVVHRDLKPENVLFVKGDDGGEQVVISDFGCGRFLERDTPTITMSGAPLGSLAYMAPEQWGHANEASVPADIYALGRVLYEMLTNDLSAAEPDLRRVPARYKYVIGRCTQHNPEKRYASVSEFRRDLDLVTHQPDHFRTSKERLTELLKKAVVSESLGPEDANEIGRMLIENAEDHSLIINLARFPQNVIDLLLEETPGNFREILRSFDEAVSGGLSFEFTDVVAEFYARIFHALADLELQAMVIARLNLIGCSHNRWHVGRVLARVLQSIKDPSLALAARDALQAYPAGIRFVSKYVLLSDLPAVLREVFRDEDAE